MLDLIERGLLVFRITAYLGLGIIIFGMARRIEQQEGNGAKTALVEIMWSFGLLLIGLFAGGTLKLITDLPFDPANIIIIPILAIIIVMIRVYLWNKGNR